MKVSILLRVFEDPAARDRLRPTYQIAEAAERNGFDGVFVSHHHFRSDAAPGSTSAPWVVLAAVAARTSELRLGTAILLLPTYHPLDVAETVATLDRLSGGRVTLGVGLGYRHDEYDALGLPYRRRAARLAEALEILPAVWGGAPTSYHGDQFRFDDVVVEPTPVQRPHPPLWVGAVAWKAQQRAARLGDGWISDLMEPLPRERHLADRYRGLCAEAGRTPVVCLMRTAAIAAHREELESRWLPAAASAQLAYWRAGARSRDDDGLFDRLDRGEPVSLPEFARDRLVAGAPEDCAEQLLAFGREVGPDHLLLDLSGAAPGPDGLRAAVELFGREVLPALSGQG